MCEGYESERASICREEDQATREGYAAARERKNRADNPYHPDTYAGKAWLHGLGCYEEGIIPWAIEKAQSTQAR